MGRSRLVIVVVVVVVVITHSSNGQMSALALDRNLARRLMGWGRGGGSMWQQWLSRHNNTPRRSSGRPRPLRLGGPSSPSAPWGCALTTQSEWAEDILAVRVLVGMLN